MTTHNQDPQAGPKMEPRRYDFTATQRKHLQPLIDKGAEIQSRISWFMNFIVDDANLPAPVDGYTLRFDGDGTPYMEGMIAAE